MLAEQCILIVLEGRITQHLGSDDKGLCCVVDEEHQWRWKWRYRNFRLTKDQKTSQLYATSEGTCKCADFHNEADLHHSDKMRVNSGGGGRGGVSVLTTQKHCLMSIMTTCRKISRVGTPTCRWEMTYQLQAVLCLLIPLELDKTWVGCRKEPGSIACGCKLPTK